MAKRENKYIGEVVRDQGFLCAFNMWISPWWWEHHRQVPAFTGVIVLLALLQGQLSCTSEDTALGWSPWFQLLNGAKENRQSRKSS